MPVGTGTQGYTLPPAMARMRASYTADPALQLVLSSVDMDVAQARAQADERRRKLLLEYGDPTLAGTFYSGPAESGYLGSVTANPYGFQQSLKRKQERDVRDVNEAMNQQNLWYGGARAKTLGELSESYAEQRYGASQATQGALMEIADFLLGSEADARNRRIAAELDAYSRALQSQVPRG